MSFSQREREREQWYEFVARNNLLTADQQRQQQFYADMRSVQRFIDTYGRPPGSDNSVPPAERRLGLWIREQFRRFGPYSIPDELMRQFNDVRQTADEVNVATEGATEPAATSTPHLVTEYEVAVANGYA